MRFDLPFELPDGWEIKTVEQLINEEILVKPLDGNHGGIHPKSSDYVSKGIPFVMASDLHAGRVDLSGCKFITEEQANTLRKGFAKAGDVLISHKATIGRTAIVQQNDYPHVMLTPQVTYYRIIDDEKLSNVYLKAYFDSPFFQSLLASWAGSGSTRAYLGITGQLKLPVIVPPISSQKLIANHVFTLNEKIENNTQTNQTLEQIAQALFKSWFVDFDPVKAKIKALAASGSADDAELAAMRVISAKTLDELEGLKASKPEVFDKIARTAALFPAAMQDSELGEIPEGWSYCPFGDISACFDSKRIPLSKRKREEKRPGTIPYYGATSVMDYVNEWIFDDTYLLLGEDGSVVKDDGTPFVQYIWGKSWVNNHAHVLQGNNGVSTEHLMVFIKGTNIASYVTGAVQLKLNQKNMNSIPFLKACTEINLVFQRVLNGLYDAYKNNMESSQSLSLLRDSLLARLLSGKMELKDKE